MAKLTTLEGLDMQNPYVKYGLIAAAGIGVYMLMKKSSGLSDDMPNGMSGLSSRKVTDKVVGAFMDGTKAKVGNTSTDGTTLKLHGNTIAKKEDGKLMITDAGWATNTTKERLNGIPGVSISQKKGVWYLNGKKWDGEWIAVEKGLSGWKHAKNRISGAETIEGERIKCYDSGPKDNDRYTVVYVDMDEGGGKKMCYCLNGSPNSPNMGFAQHSSCMVGPHLGKRVKFASLPEVVQKAVKQDLKQS